MRTRKRALGLVLVFTLLIAAAACQARTQTPIPTRTPFPTLAPTPRPTPAPTPTPKPEPADSYVALAPRMLRAGTTEAISVSLIKQGRPLSGSVEAVLLKDGATIAQGSGEVRGAGTVSLNVPRVPEGSYVLELRGPGFTDQATVQVQEGTLVFTETDKPIYKPGQTIHIRVLTLDAGLKPLPGPVTVEAQDAKGIKVFKRQATSDEYGMVSLDLPLSTEPNLGVWKVTTLAGKQKSQVDVRVEEYVLPKYEVKVNLPRSWVLAGETVKGTISAEYSYGKPVRGTAVITARRYVGVWQEYAKITREIDGSGTFELPPAGYVAGVPGSGGKGNLQIDVTMEERNTGYEQKATSLVTVAPTPVGLQVIPESATFKPGLPLTLLLITQTPDNQPLNRDVTMTVSYMDQKMDRPKRETVKAITRDGKALVKLTPPKEAIAFVLEATADGAHAALTLQAGYSPTASFIHVEQTTSGPLKVGDRATFHISSTKEARNFYYEVLGRGKVLFSDFATSPDISFILPLEAAPSARLLVYQVLPTSEVAADYIPFSVEGDYPQQVKVAFSAGEVKPGDQVGIQVQTQGQAKVGLAAVDRSVYILAENRLNLRQVFDELERLYQKPQVELHDAAPLYKVTTQGAKETFADAGVVVLTNQRVPEGQQYESPQWAFPMAGPEKAMDLAMAGAQPPVPAPAASPDPARNGGAAGLADVQRVRQFFPETWLWADLMTDSSGKATLPATAPDSITTWMLRAVAISKERGLGIGEAQLKVFQPFFLQADLPYSAIRGEEFPVRVSLYNYLNTPQRIQVELERQDGFELTGPAIQTVQVGASDLGGASFTIRPRTLGKLSLKITARSPQAADAVIKDLLVEPEGVFRETIENIVLSAGSNRMIDTSIPLDTVPDSGRAYVALTGSYLTQSIDGLEGLLRMPFGCGEQNMLLFAPNVFVAQYLKQTGQIKPEIMARADNLMVTGYQREMTYRRGDGSFSAFGQQDKDGSLWLTAFVLKTFSQATDLVYIDPSVLDSATTWVVKQQRADGSFEPVGFLHHQELLGGLKGNTALTAFVTAALIEAGEKTASAKAVAYLEGRLGSIDDPYTMAITAYALELAHSPRAGAAYDKLMGMAVDDQDGLHWGGDMMPLKEPAPMPGIRGPMPPQPRMQSSAVENTGYGLLALLAHGDRINASRASRWLVSRRNAFGGFGSTQDTVVGLQALTRFSSAASSDVDMAVTLSAGSWKREVRITPQNADVLQMVEVPIGADVQVQAQGKGEAVLQAVRRFNLPEVPVTRQEAFQITVDYSADQVAVNDLITISANVRFTPSEPIEAGMVVLDIAVPTGFAPEVSTLQALVKNQPKVKRYDVAGRKVILYIENLMPDESIAVKFQARAMYPVRAQAVVSQAYSYYNPGLQGESLGTAVNVTEG